eukprot:gene39106-48298_t
MAYSLYTGVWAGGCMIPSQTVYSTLMVYNTSVCFPAMDSNYFLAMDCNTLEGSNSNFFQSKCAAQFLVAETIDDNVCIGSSYATETNYKGNLEYTCFINTTSVPTARPSVIPSGSPFFSQSPTLSVSLAPTSTSPTFVASLAPSSLPVFTPTAAPTDTSVVFSASQIISGISFETYLTNTSNYDRTIATSIAATMTGVTSQNVVNLVVTEYIANVNSNTRSRLLTNSTQLSTAYVVSVSTEQVSGATYISLSNQLNQAVTLGVFNAYLTEYAVEFEATGLYGATSSSVVTTNDVVVNDDTGGGSGSSALSTGVIVGLLALFALVGIYYFVCLRRRKPSNHSGDVPAAVVMSDIKNPLDPSLRWDDGRRGGVIQISTVIPAKAGISCGADPGFRRGDGKCSGSKIAGRMARR